MPNGFDILATYFGVSLAGCAIVPINARFRTRELGYIVENADLACVITNDANDAYVNYLDLLLDSIEARGGAPLLRHMVVLGEREREGVLSDAAFDALGADVRRGRRAPPPPRRQRRRPGDDPLHERHDRRPARRDHLARVDRARVGAARSPTRCGSARDDRMWNPCPMFHIAAMGVSRRVRRPTA